MVVVEYTASGSVEDISSSAIAANMAKAAGVSVSAVSVSLSPGSVNVKARIGMSDQQSADAAKESLERQMADPAAASAVTGTQVETLPNVRVEKKAGDSFLGGMIFFLVCALLACCCLSPFCFWMGMKQQHRSRKKSLAVSDHVDLDVTSRSGAPGPPGPPSAPKAQPSTGSMHDVELHDSELNDAARASLRLSQAQAKQAASGESLAQQQSSFEELGVQAPQEDKP